ncbi:hypothetical protein [Agaribacter flavus]|uniref:Orphan protein n=1 Tax=Agaribacter flavus TaxID=1902781 RepID=A0ABV7FMP5_9ALTE
MLTLDNKSYLRHLSISESLLDDVSLLSDVYLQRNPDIKKYAKRSTDEILRHLVSRHYNNISWELAHLLWALVQCECQTRARQSTSAIIDFFWLNEAIYPKNAQDWFTTNTARIEIPDSALTLRDQALVIQIRQHQFTIKLSRINVLSCLVEFILNITPDTIEQWQDKLWQQGVNAIRQVSSDIQQRLYHYLNEHLPPVRLAKKYAFFSSHHLDANNLSREDFIKLWIEAKPIEGLGKLSSLFESLLNWQFAQSHASDSEGHFEQAAVHAPESEDLDSQFSESVFKALSSLTETELDLPSFACAPKLLSKIQVDKLSMLGQFPQQSVKSIALFFVVWSFSPIQLSLIQASRNNSTKRVSDNDILDKVEQLDTYQTHRSFLRALFLLNEQTMMACWQIIRLNFANDAINAFCLVNDWLNQFSKAFNKEYGAIAESDSQCYTDKISMALIEQVLPEFIEKCERALKKNKRLGFTPDSLLSEGEVYIQAIDKLNQLNQLIGRCEKNINKEFYDEALTEENYLADRFIITNELVQRYVK